jgi:ubiquinone/menaquinone biosynthesis C-methylase UbiE
VNDAHRHERRFRGEPDRLRSVERIALLEVERVVALSMEGLTVVRSVLDVGTGTGVFAEAFSKLTQAVTGIDTNAGLLAIARRYVPDAQFRKAPAERIPFADHSFDLVFLGHVLHETDSPLQALKEARRVARSRVVVLEWPYHEEEEQGPPLEHRLRPEVIEDLAGKANFQLVERIKLAHMDFYRLTINSGRT